MLDLAEGGEGDAVGGGDEEDGVVDAETIDGVGVREVHVIAGGEDGGHEFRGDEAGEFAGDGGFAGGEVCPGVIGWKQECDLIGRLALAEEPANALDVACDVGHDGVPGIVVVEDSGGVEGPAGLAYLWGGVGPAVADDLVLAHDEVDVGFGLHVEGSGSEDG